MEMILPEGRLTSLPMMFITQHGKADAVSFVLKIRGHKLSQLKEGLGWMQVNQFLTVRVVMLWKKVSGLSTLL